MSEVMGTYRSDVQICSCGSHVFKLLKENGGYTTKCRCGFACGPWCEDADSAIQQLINQAKESFQPGYIEVEEGTSEETRNDELRDISPAFCDFFEVKEKLEFLGEQVGEETIASLLLTDQLSRIAENMETTGEFGDNVCRIVNNLDAINRTIAMQ